MNVNYSMSQWLLMDACSIMSSASFISLEWCKHTTKWLEKVEKSSNRLLRINPYMTAPTMFCGTKPERQIDHYIVLSAHLCCALFSVSRVKWIKGLFMHMCVSWGMRAVFMIHICGTRPRLVKPVWPSGDIWLLQKTLVRRHAVSWTSLGLMWIGQLKTKLCDIWKPIPSCLLGNAFNNIL